MSEIKRMLNPGTLAREEVKYSRDAVGE